MSKDAPNLFDDDAADVPRDNDSTDMLLETPRSLYRRFVDEIKAFRGGSGDGDLGDDELEDDFEISMEDPPEDQAKEPPKDSADRFGNLFGAPSSEDSAELNLDAFQESNDFGFGWKMGDDFSEKENAEGAQNQFEGEMSEGELAKKLMEEALMWASPSEGAEDIQSQIEAQRIQDKEAEKRSEENRKKFTEMALKGELKKTEEKHWGIFKSMEKIYTFGVCRVELETEDGKSIFNFLDAENQVVHPEKWFDSAEEFKIRPFKVLIFLSADDEPVSLVETDGRYDFLTKYGQLFDAKVDDIVIYKKTEDEIDEDDGWGSIQVEMKESREDPLDYIDKLCGKMSAIAERLSPKEQEEFNELLEEIKSTKKSTKVNSKWADILLALKNKIEFSDISKEYKRLFIFDLWAKARSCKMDPLHEIQLFPIITKSVTSITRDSKALKFENSFLHIQYATNGMVIGMLNKKTKSVEYFIVHNGLCMNHDDSFDNVNPFVGMLALVKRGKEYNFLRKDSGKLLNSEWFNEEPMYENGVFIIRDKEKIRYLNQKDCSYYSDNNPKVLFIKLKHFAKSLFYSKKSGKDLSYDIDGEWSPVFPEEKQPEVIKESINKSVHHGFQQLLLSAENHQESIKLMRLFNGIRKVLNVDGEAGKLSSTLTQLQLKKCIIDTKLSPQKREEIEKFVISLINSSRYEWEEASPLPINFVMIYRGLIQNFTGEYLEKVALIGLFRKMESSLNLLPDKTGDFTKLLPKYREAIEKAKLPPKAKGRIKLVLNELVSHIYSKNVDIRGGFSMTAFLSNLKKKRVAPPTKPSALRKPESDDTIEKRPRKIPESKIVTKKIEKPEVIVESRSRMKLMWVAGAVIAGAGIAVPAYLYFSDQDRKYQQAMEYMHDGDRNNLKKATKDINDNIHLDDIEHLLLQAEFNLNLAKKNRGNYEDAAGCFERILTKNPDDLEIQRRFFYAHKELGQDLQGLKSFVEMEKINSEFLNILINEYEALKNAKAIKGKVRRGRQNNRIYNNTINDLIGSLAAGEDNVEKRFEIARRYELLGRTDEAEYIYLLGASKFADYNPFAEAIARLQKK